jgi:hypothetical protein
MRQKKNMLPIGALLLIAIGGLWLAQDMGWLTTQISWWPIILIVLGAGILINHYSK